MAGASAATIMRFALGIRDWMLSLLSVVLLLTSVFWISAFFYGSFYFSYVPGQQHLSRDVNWVFQTCEGKIKSLSASRCSNLFANVSLEENHWSFLPGQKYSLVLDLWMPQSPRNQELGMFIICLDLIRDIDIDGNSDLDEKSVHLSSLDRVCRSALMSYKSPHTLLVQDILRAPFEMLGLEPHTEKLSVVFLDSFVPDTYISDSQKQANLEIMTGGRDADFLAGKLSIFADFNGLRHLMFHHPVIASCFGISLIATMVFTVMFFFWRKVFEPRVTVGIYNNGIHGQRERARTILNNSESQRKLLQRAKDSSNNCLNESDIVNLDTSGVDGNTNNIRKRFVS